MLKFVTAEYRRPRRPSVCVYTYFAKPGKKELVGEEQLACLSCLTGDNNENKRGMLVSLVGEEAVGHCWI